MRLDVNAVIPAGCADSAGMMRHLRQAFLFPNQECRCSYCVRFGFSDHSGITPDRNAVSVFGEPRRRKRPLPAGESAGADFDDVLVASRPDSILGLGTSVETFSAYWHRTFGVADVRPALRQTLVPSTASPASARGSGDHLLPLPILVIFLRLATIA